MNCYLVCFDISEDKVRRRVGNYLERYGDRVQYSVFEIAVNRAEELNRLKQQIKDLLEPGDDVRFYYLNAESRRQSHDCNDNPVALFPAAIIV